MTAVQFWLSVQGTHGKSSTAPMEQPETCDHCRILVADTSPLTSSFNHRMSKIKCSLTWNVLARAPKWCCWAWAHGHVSLSGPQRPVGWLALTLDQNKQWTLPPHDLQAWQWPDQDLSGLPTNSLLVSLSSPDHDPLLSRSPPFVIPLLFCPPRLLLCKFLTSMPGNKGHAYVMLELLSIYLTIFQPLSKFLWRSTGFCRWKSWFCTEGFWVKFPRS